MDEILNDYQHLVETTITQYQDRPDFPMLEHYHITQAMLKDYLFDKQAILDSAGSARTQYTIAGILIVLPVLVMSAFSEKQLPWGSWSIIVAVIIGLLLFTIYKVVQKLFIKHRLKKLYSRDIEAYIEAVLTYATRRH